MRLRGAPKRELGDERPLAGVTGELVEGWRRLAALFPGARRVMVPPWNRIAAPVTAALPALGYRGVSTFAARCRRDAAPGLVRANTHIDIVDWRGTRGFAGAAAAIGAAVGASRRRGVPARRTLASRPGCSPTISRTTTPVGSSLMASSHALGVILRYGGSMPTKRSERGA